jgi:hypothetical protein
MLKLKTLRAENNAVTNKEEPDGAVHDDDNP